LKGLGIEPSNVVDWMKEEVGTWRERRYGPLTTLMMFIGQVTSADQSCQDAVAREAAHGEGKIVQNTGPYCRARGRLPLRLIERFATEVGGRMRAGQRDGWRWRGREVKLVDGSTVSMPDTEENQERFPQSGTQKARLGFPVARIVAVISLSCGAVLNWAIGPCKGKHSGETSMLREMAASAFEAGDLLLADRYYAGYFMLDILTRYNVDIIMRQHQLRKTDFRRGKRLGKGDHIVTWTKPARPAGMDQDTYASMPDSLILREVRVAKWIIVTSLLDANEVSKRELSALYTQRWQIELDLRSIKSVMQMDILRCLTPDGVEKEIAVHLLAYNLIRAAMTQAACVGNIYPRQISFKATLQLIRAFAGELRRCPGQRYAIRHADMVQCIASNRLLHRPGRVEPRVRKRRPSNYPLMTKSRDKMKKPLIKQKAAIDALLR
jgi:hypothetical protein